MDFWNLYNWHYTIHNIHNLLDFWNLHFVLDGWQTLLLLLYNNMYNPVVDSKITHGFHHK